MTRRIFVLVAWALALAGSLALDAPVARFVMTHRFNISYDLYAMFRLAGFIPLWATVAIVFALIDSRDGWKHAWSRGGCLFATVVVAGSLAELSKIAIRRTRPHLPAFAYAFRPWRETPLSTTGLGWPSSHAAVAFGAVWILCRLYPRAAPVWLLIGVGCGLSRLAGGDHYVSDIVGGALVAYAVAAAMWRVRARVA
jgi:membrane-associated phospholipid phosphatase